MCRVQNGRECEMGRRLRGCQCSGWSWADIVVVTHIYVDDAVRLEVCKRWTKTRDSGKRGVMMYISKVCMVQREGMSDEEEGREEVRGVGDVEGIRSCVWKCIDWIVSQRSIQIEEQRICTQLLMLSSGLCSINKSRQAPCHPIHRSIVPHFRSWIIVSYRPLMIAWSHSKHHYRVMAHIFKAFSHTLVWN